jgi:LEA14-like dessication related protein
MSDTRGFAVIALASLALAACTLFVPKLVAPKLEVTAVTFIGGNLLQQRLRLGLHAINPNNTGVLVNRIDCHLEILGTPLADGTTESAFTLPPHGEADFVLNVSAQLANAMGLISAASNHSTVEYRLYGEVHFGSGFVRTLPFDERGQVRL